MDLDVLAVFPHAHYLATLMEGYATLPDGTRKWLIRIPDWDKAGRGYTAIASPCSCPGHGDFDALSLRQLRGQRAQSQPSAQARTGGQPRHRRNGSPLAQVLPVGQGDQRAVLQEALMRQRLQKYPGDFSANFSLGALLLDQGDAAGADSLL